MGDPEIQVSQERSPLTFVVAKSRNSILLACFLLRLYLQLKGAGGKWLTES